MSRSDVLVDADWVQAHLDTPASFSSRSTRTPAPTTRATSVAPSASTGRRTCRTRSAATSWTRRASRRCCPGRASPTTTPWSSTAATTTGSPPTRTGTSGCTATRTSSCSTAAARSGSWTPATLVEDVAERAEDQLHGQGAGPVDPRLPRRGRRRHRQAEPRRRPLARRVLRQAARPGAPAAGAGAAGRRTARRGPFGVDFRSAPRRAAPYRVVEVIGHATACPARSGRRFRPEATVRTFPRGVEAVAGGYLCAWVRPVRSRREGSWIERVGLRVRGGPGVRDRQPSYATGATAEMPTDRAARREWHEVREGAAALRAESPQTRRRAAEMRSEANALLDAVVWMVTSVLRGHGFAVQAPVEARFRCDENGSTGFEVEVRLEEPSHADAATAILSERFPDPLSSMVVR